MMYRSNLKLFYLVFFTIFYGVISYPLSQEQRDKGFVYLHEIDPTILVSLRYYRYENFLGRPVEGYKKPFAILTKQAALALKQVQEDVKKDGYCLVLYDAYRPQRAVNDFMTWSQDVTDQIKKEQYYPRIDKNRVFELGYVAERSGHSRGSTVDVTLIEDGKQIHDIVLKKRVFSDGVVITLLDDGTIDMGSSFDLFDVVSHYENDLISLDSSFAQLKTYLKSIMFKNGFNNYAEEWWHFTLQNEPFQADLDSSYFDFEIE